MMAVSDEELARAKGVSVELVRLVRETRGTTNETLEALPDEVFMSAQQRLLLPDRPSARAEFRFLQGLGDDGSEPPLRAVEAAVNALNVAVAANEAIRVAGVPTAVPAEPDWEWLGPRNVAGRIRGLAIDSDRPEVMWAASAGGGVWRTVDGGVTWVPAEGVIGSLPCGSIAMHPLNRTLYVGTGEGFGNIDAIPGGGVFVSHDGQNWVVLPETRKKEFRLINRIAVSGSGVLLVATRAGLFRSADEAHVMWDKVIGDMPVADVKFHPRDGMRAVAGGGKDSGQAWFTTNGGVDWTLATHPGEWSGRIELAYAAKDPDVVYASVQMTAGEIWRSTDGGVSFERRGTLTTTGVAAPYLGDQGWYGNAIWAGDPTDTNLVIVGGVNLWRSIDGGDVLAEISTWQVYPASPHADQHAIVAHPRYDGTTNRTVFFGSDGGVYVAEDLDAVGREEAPPYRQHWADRSNTLGVTQFYGGAGHADSGKIVGGAQDIGTLCYDPAAGPGAWKRIFDGDGGWCASDPSDPSVFYAEYTNLNIRRNMDGGTTADTSGMRFISGRYYDTAVHQWKYKPAPFSIPDAMPSDPDNALFIAPFVLDPNAPHRIDRILAGGRSLWRTNDAKTPNTNNTGPSWQQIKPPTGQPGVLGLISALAIAPGDSGTVWVGHVNGDVFHTADATAQAPTWMQVTQEALPPQRFCLCIVVDPADKAVVYVAFGGYARTNLWATDNGGMIWTNIHRTLPTAPVRAIALHPRRRQFLYVGTEVGLYASDNGGETWSPTSQGPTSCSVEDLFWMGETLVSVTHGRGMYRIDLSNVD